MAEIIKNMSDEEYFAHPALSQSRLKKYLISPYKAKFFPEQDDFDLGLKLHGYGLECVLFEGKKAFESKYCVSKYKTYCDSMKEEGAILGATPLTKATYEQLLGVEEALRWNASAADLIKRPGDTQLVILFEYQGIQCKVKLDKLIKTDKGYIILDLKSFAPRSAISTRSLAYHCKDYMYDVQAWFYTLAVMTAFNVGEDDVVFINIFVEKHLYPEILSVTIDQANIDAAKIKVDYGINVYNDCMHKVITLNDMLIIKQNALADIQANFLTVGWPEQEIPEILL